MASPQEKAVAAFAHATGDIEARQPGEVNIFDLSLVVKGTRKNDQPRKILSNVSCNFPPGRLSAVMGASGSGKTSVLTAIRGLQAAGSETCGQVLCNGMPVNMELMRHLVSAVPQEDVFLAALTPREMLSFAAELRLPNSWSERDWHSAGQQKDRQKRVNEVLQLLHIEKCADTAIGDEKIGVRGISGGERRRLSVGMAIIGGLPQVLLCDEPTSGLDSAAASNMVAVLKSLAGRGVTVVAAIHQPSYAVFSEFDFLLLLEAGHIVYSGKVTEAEAYFSKSGATTPDKTNPAHHYVQIVQDESRKWIENWQAFSSKTSGGAAKADGKPSVKVKVMPSLWEQTSILTRRTLLENFKNKKKFYRGIMTRLPPSIMIGCIFYQMAAVYTQKSIFPVKGVMFLCAQNPLIESFYAGDDTATFQQTKGLLKREYYDGVYQVLPYYLSYYIGFLAMQVPWTLAWATPLYLLVGFPLDFYRFFVFVLTSFLVLLLACAAGSAVGAKTRDADGNRSVLMPLIIPSTLFSGREELLDQVKILSEWPAHLPGYVIPYAQIPLVWKPFYYASPIMWGMSILETSLYQGAEFGDCDSSIPFSRRHCYATGEEYLKHSTCALAQQLGVFGMIGVCLIYSLQCNRRSCDAGQRRAPTATFGYAPRDAGPRFRQSDAERPASARLGRIRVPHPELPPRQEILKFCPIGRR
eukprot:g6935.t1